MQVELTDIKITELSSQSSKSIIRGTEINGWSITASAKAKIKIGEAETQTICILDFNVALDQFDFLSALVDKINEELK